MRTEHFASLTIPSSTGPRAHLRGPPGDVPTVPFDPLAPPSHDEEVHRLLADRVQDDLVDFVADLDDRTGVDPHVLADPGEALEPSNPVVHVPEPNRLRREVPGNLHDMKET